MKKLTTMVAVAALVCATTSCKNYCLDCGHHVVRMVDQKSYLFHPDVNRYHKHHHHQGN